MLGVVVLTVLNVVLLTWCFLMIRSGYKLKA